MDAVAPKMWGERWVIVRPLGEGGQAHTYLVKDKSTGEPAALKRLKNVKRLGRFEQEIEALRSIQHPGIVFERRSSHFDACGDSTGRRHGIQT